MKITEHNYGMPREAYYGTIFSQPNGYMGVRASFGGKRKSWCPGGIYQR